MSATYKPSRTGFQEMARSKEIRAALVAIAEKGKAFAEARAEDFRKTGDYASKFVVTELSVIIPTEPPTGFRAAARLENLSRHAAAVEWGNRGHRRHRVLGETLDFLGQP